MPAISYTLLIDNAPASAALLDALQQIEVEEHTSMASMLRLRFAVGPKADGSGYNVVDDDHFQRLTRLMLLVSVGTGLPEPLIDAFVVETKGEFSNQPGGSTFEVVAMDAMLKLNLEEKIRPWANMADSDIATLIFAEHNLLPIADRTQPVRIELEHTVIQHGTDLELLRSLAKRNGYECYVETNPVLLAEGHFHPPRLSGMPQGTLSVNMGGESNVDRFSVRFDMVKPVTADAAGLAISSQSDQNGSASSVSLDQLGTDSALATSDPHKVLVSRTGLAETGELQTYAQAVVDEAAWAVTAEGELTTAAFGKILRARRPVLVRGVGQQFSGTYYVEKVQHLISGDTYTQSFTLRRNATGLQGIEPFALA